MDFQHAREATQNQLGTNSNVHYRRMSEDGGRMACYHIWRAQKYPVTSLHVGVTHRPNLLKKSAVCRKCIRTDVKSSTGENSDSSHVPELPDILHSEKNEKLSTCNC